MNIREAVANIIGERLCASIVADMGMHWAVIAAMTEAKTPTHDRECAVINAYLAQLKREQKSASRAEFQT